MPFQEKGYVEQLQKISHSEGVLENREQPLPIDKWQDQLHGSKTL